MTPEEIAIDVVRQLRWDNDTQWHKIIAAALTAERRAREKAERTLQIYAGDVTSAQLEADREHEARVEAEARAEKAEVELVAIRAVIPSQCFGPANDAPTQLAVMRLDALREKAEAERDEALRDLGAAISNNARLVIQADDAREAALREAVWVLEPLIEEPVSPHPSTNLREGQCRILALIPKEPSDG